MAPVRKHLGTFLDKTWGLKPYSDRQLKALARLTTADAETYALADSYGAAIGNRYAIGFSTHRGTGALIDPENARFEAEVTPVRRDPNTVNFNVVVPLTDSAVRRELTQLTADELLDYGREGIVVAGEGARRGGQAVNFYRNNGGLLQPMSFIGRQAGTRSVLLDRKPPDKVSLFRFGDQVYVRMRYRFDETIGREEKRHIIAAWDRRLAKARRERENYSPYEESDRRLAAVKMLLMEVAHAS